MVERRGTRARLLAVALVAVTVLSGCGSAAGGRGLGPHDEKTPVKAEETTTVRLDHGDRLRIAVRGEHDVVTQHYDHADKRWTHPRRLVDLADRECGIADATTANETIAVTLECDQDYAEDQAPTDSLAVVSKDLVHWARHDLRGEAYRMPGVSPDGRHAIWSQGGGVLLWSDSGFAARPTGSVDGVSVTDDGAPVTATVRNCDIRFRGPVDGRVRISRPGQDEAGYCSFQLNEMHFETPEVLRVSVDGATAGTRLLIRRDGDRWRLASAANG